MPRFSISFAPAAALAIAGSLAASGAQACDANYEVRFGDTLSTIAQDHYGSVFEFRRIYEANADVIGANPNRIRPGSILNLPCLDGAEVDGINWSVMPNAKTLVGLVEDESVQVLDIRDMEMVAKGVIPGSIWVPFENWRGPEDNLGEPLSPPRLAQIIGGAGLRLDEPIVVVHGRDKPMETGASALVYWLLKSSGADQLAILRGGFDSWYYQGLPVMAKPAAPEPYVATVSFSREWRADEVDVYNISTGQSDGLLLDARPHGMFERFSDLGKALASTLPGASNLPAPALMSVLSGEVDVENGVQAVVDTFASVNGNQGDGPIVTFCHVGELGALNWFYASELAGIEDVQLYPESVNGWTHGGGALGLGRGS